MLKTFFGTDDKGEAKKKAKKIAFWFPTYWIAEYFLAALTFSLVVFLKLHAFGFLFIFLTLWLINIVLAGSVIFLHDWSGIDFTTMAGRRRWFNALLKKLSYSGKVIAILFEIVYCAYLIVWDGADWFLLFFRDRLKTRSKIVGAFFITTAVQMAIWTAIYSLGYDGVGQLIRRYWK